jgi:hypothetical protein
LDLAIVVVETLNDLKIVDKVRVIELLAMPFGSRTMNNLKSGKGV